MEELEKVQDMSNNHHFKTFEKIDGDSLWRSAVMAKTNLVKMGLDKAAEQGLGSYTFYVDSNLANAVAEDIMACMTSAKIYRVLEGKQYRNKVKYKIKFYYNPEKEKQLEE